MTIIEEIKNGEGKRLELKEQLPSNDSIAKSAIAFSNTSGGKIIIGVKDNQEIIGIGEGNLLEMEEKISSIISDLCYPNILPDIYSINIKNIILLVVEIYRGGLLPYHLSNSDRNNSTYLRIGSTNRRADELMIMELERQRKSLSFDEMENFDFAIEDMNLDLVYGKFEEINKKVDYQKLKNLKLIKQYQKKDLPVMALAICLGKLDNVVVKCAKFKGINMNEFIDKKEFKGDLFSIIENTISFLKNHLNLNVKINGLQRDEGYEIPLVVLREVILNAIIHRDYTRNRDVKVAIYDDIVEIISPGAFPNGITIEDISNGRSELRNKILANLFKELGYIESWGSGISRTKNICKGKSLHFSIKEKGDFVEVIFGRPQATASDRKRPQAIVSDYKKHQGYEIQKVLDFIEKHGKIVKRDVIDLLNCGETKAKEVLKELIGVQIEMVNKGKYTYYVKK